MRTMLGVLVAFAMLAVVGVSAASASPPLKTYTPESVSVFELGLCPQSVAVTETWTKFTEIDFFDQTGNLTTIHWTFFSQDVFVGPTGTLVGEKYHGNIQIKFDSSGDYASAIGTGLLEKVRLPDGSLFVGAGRLDWLAYGPGVPTFTPDNGHSGNLDAFCEALGAD